MSQPETVTVKLSKPLKFGEGEAAREWTELTFREATVGDLIAAEKIGGGEIGLVAATLAASAGIPWPAFQKISARDMRRIVAEAGELAGN